MQFNKYKHRHIHTGCIPNSYAFIISCHVRPTLNFKVPLPNQEQTPKPHRILPSFQPSTCGFLARKTPPIILPNTTWSYLPEAAQHLGHSLPDHGGLLPLNEGDAVVCAREKLILLGKLDAGTGGRLELVDDPPSLRHEKEQNKTQRF